MQSCSISGISVVFFHIFCSRRRRCVWLYVHCAHRAARVSNIDVYATSNRSQRTQPNSLDDRMYDMSESYAYTRSYSAYGAYINIKRKTFTEFKLEPSTLSKVKHRVESKAGERNQRFEQKNLHTPSEQTKSANSLFSLQTKSNWFLCAKSVVWS